MFKLLGTWPGVSSTTRRRRDERRHVDRRTPSGLGPCPAAIPAIAMSRLLAPGDSGTVRYLHRSFRRWRGDVGDDQRTESRARSPDLPPLLPASRRPDSGRFGVAGNPPSGSRRRRETDREGGDRGGPPRRGVAPRLVLPQSGRARGGPRRIPADRKPRPRRRGLRTAPEAGPDDGSAYAHPDGMSGATRSRAGRREGPMSWS